MKMTVKRWIADKAQTEAKRYNYFFNVEYVNGFYADIENDTVTLESVEIIKETEKAVQVAIGCGAIDGKVETWNAWLPKSQIVA